MKTNYIKEYITIKKSHFESIFNNKSKLIFILFISSSIFPDITFLLNNKIIYFRLIYEIFIIILFDIIIIFFYYFVKLSKYFFLFYHLYYNNIKIQKI